MHQNTSQFSGKYFLAGVSLGARWTLAKVWCPGLGISLSTACSPNFGMIGGLLAALRVFAHKEPLSEPRNVLPARLHFGCKYILGVSIYSQLLLNAALSGLPLGRFGSLPAKNRSSAASSRIGPKIGRQTVLELNRACHPAAAPEPSRRLLTRPPKKYFRLELRGDHCDFGAHCDFSKWSDSLPLNLTYVIVASDIPVPAKSGRYPSMRSRARVFLARDQVVPGTRLQPP